jgi:hypothetical protein
VDQVSDSARIPRRWLVAWIAAAATGALVLVTVVSSRGSDRRPPCRGTLIPAYITPAAIADLVDGPEHRRLIVINPASGPGHAPHPPYREAVAAAHDSGAQVVGYVPTGYGARDPAAVQADIDRYREWYGVDGVFLDEAAHDEALVPHYRALSLQAREAGVGLVVLNPGMVPAEGYFDLADVVVTYEGPATGYADALARIPDWVRRQPPDRIGHLVYAASREQALAAAESPLAPGWLYVTSGDLPNPWRTVPDYLDEEEAALRSCA